MNEDFQWNEDYQIDLLADRFEKMINTGGHSYFDSEEFEVLIDYYQNIFDNNKARSVLEIAMQQHPTSLGLRVKLARQLAAEGNYKISLSMLEDIEKSEPNEPEIIMTKGSVFSMMNESEKAVSELKKAVFLVDEEELEELYTSIAFEYEKIENYELALTYFKLALAFAPDSDSVLYEIGMCFTMSHQMDEAIGFFNTQIDINPYNVSAWYNLGLIYFQMEMFESAINAFEFVLSIDERYTAAYQSMAHCFAAMEENHKAIEVYLESFEFEQPEAMTYYFIGECYEKLKEFELSLEYYRKSIDLDPQLADPWAGIGAIFDEKGDIDNAIKYTLKAIGLDPSNIELHLIMADQLIKQNEYDKAEVFFLKAEELDPNDPDLYIEYANMFVLKNEHHKAIEMLQKGMIHQPDNYLIMYRLGATYLYVNDIFEAIFILDLALKNDFEGHTELLEYYPDVFNHPEVVELFAEYKPAK